MMQKSVMASGGYYVATHILMVWKHLAGLAPDQPHGWSFPDVRGGKSEVATCLGLMMYPPKWLYANLMPCDPKRKQVLANRDYDVGAVAILLKIGLMMVMMQPNMKPLSPV